MDAPRESKPVNWGRIALELYRYANMRREDLPEMCLAEMEALLREVQEIRKEEAQLAGVRF